jgi:hypothetical protein
MTTTPVFKRDTLGRKQVCGSIPVSKGGSIVVSVEDQHNIDLKDDKYGGEQLADIHDPFGGIVFPCNDDDPRLECGGAVPGEHYRYCASRQAGK